MSSYENKFLKCSVRAQVVSLIIDVEVRGIIRWYGS